MSIGNLPEDLRPQILAGIILVGRLGVATARTAVTRAPAAPIRGNLEYRIPRLHSPVNSRRFQQTFEDFCNNKASFLQFL